LKTKTISNLPEIEVLPNTDDILMKYIQKGRKLTSLQLSSFIGMSQSGMDKKLKVLERDGILKSSLERVKGRNGVKIMRVYEKT